MMEQMHGNPTSNAPEIVFLSVASGGNVKEQMCDEPLRDDVPPWWYCWGIFGFIFFVLLLSGASATNCTDTWLGYDTWLVCDNETDTATVNIFLLLAFGGLGILAVCWCSRRRAH